YFTDFVKIENESKCKSDIKEIKVEELTGGKVGEVSIINYKGKEYILKSIQSQPKSYISVRLLPSYKDDNYWKVTNQYDEEKLITAGGDNFSNQTSLHYILNIILGDNNNYIYQFDAFYCDGYGYNITE